MNLSGHGALNVLTRWVVFPGLLILLTVGFIVPTAAANVYEYDNGWWFSSMNAEVSSGGTATSDGLTNKNAEPVEITTSVAVSHWVLVDNQGLRQDWRPSGPGMYASDAMMLTIESNDDVSMDFSAGSPPVDANPTSPEQWFLFTTASSPSWDEAAWLPGHEMNGQNGSYSAQAGSQQYTLWEKANLNGQAWEQHRAVTLAIVNVRLWIDPYVQKYMLTGMPGF